MATPHRVVVQLFPNGNKFDLDINRDESLSSVLQHACQVLCFILRAHLELESRGYDRQFQLYSPS